MQRGTSMLKIIILSLSIFAAEGQDQCKTIKCQIDSYRSVVGRCLGDKSKLCKQQFDFAFKALETSMDSCSPQGTIDIATATNEDCSMLEKFVTDEVIPNSPVYSQVARGLKYINRRAELQKAFKNANHSDY